MCVVLKSPSFYMHKVAIGVVYTKLLDAITVTSVKQYTDVNKRLYIHDWCSGKATLVFIVLVTCGFIECK